jgi:aspartokinase
MFRSKRDIDAFRGQKFGGTSVGNIDRLLEVAKKVAAACSHGEKVVVVVSAMAGDTDRLVQLATQALSPLMNGNSTCCRRPVKWSQAPC